MSAIETALTELSANLRRMEQRHQAVGYKFDRLYGLIDAAREELTSLTQIDKAARLKVAAALDCEGVNFSWSYLTRAIKDLDQQAARYNALRDICSDEHVMVFGFYHTAEELDERADRLLRGLS